MLRHRSEFRLLSCRLLGGRVYDMTFNTGRVSLQHPPIAKGSARLGACTEQHRQWVLVSGIPVSIFQYVKAQARGTYEKEEEGGQSYRFAIRSKTALRGKIIVASQKLAKRHD